MYALLKVKYFTCSLLKLSGNERDVELVVGVQVAFAVFLMKLSCIIVQVRDERERPEMLLEYGRWWRSRALGTLIKLNTSMSVLEVRSLTHLFDPTPSMASQMESMLPHRH